MKKKSKNTKNNKKQLSSIIMILIVVVVAMSIAYAALSTTLNITMNKVVQSSIGGWDVHFEGSSATATVGGTGDTGRSCGVATITPNTVTVADSALSKPDDSCTYKLTIANTGGIDAVLGTITPIAPDSVSCTNNGASMVCGNVTYSLATNASGTPLLAIGGTLAKTTGTLDVYLIMKYTGTSTTSTAVTHNGGGFTLVYNQA